MAEAFGAVAGGLSLAALFNNCVTCFEYVKLGRDFGRDFGRSQLKLDVAVARLNRWGEATEIYRDPPNILDKDGSAQRVRDILDETTSLIELVRKSSKRYAQDAGAQQATEVHRVEDMGPLPLSLHSHLRGRSLKRQKPGKLFRRASWALYDAKNFDRLISEIKELIDDLEKLVPDPAAYRDLARREVEMIRDAPSLQMLHDAATGLDSTLCEAAAQMMGAVEGTNTTGDIRTEESAAVQVGNVWSERAVAFRVPDRTANTTGSIMAGHTSTVHIGNSYGIKGISIS